VKWKSIVWIPLHLSVYKGLVDREERVVRGAATVLSTLVPNARQIFRVLAEAQLEDDDQYDGQSCTANPYSLFRIANCSTILAT
jgi:hypothetical protein